MISKDLVRVSRRLADFVSDFDFMFVNVSVNVLSSVSIPFVSDRVKVIEWSSVGVSVRGMVIVPVSVLEGVDDWVKVSESVRSSEGVAVNVTVVESSSDASPVIVSDNVSSGESVKVSVMVWSCVRTPASTPPPHQRGAEGPRASAAATRALSLSTGTAARRCVPWLAAVVAAKR